MLLRDSLGGTAKTLMFVCISPADYNYDESINSLNYAARAKNITNKVVKQAESRQVQKLKKEIAYLKEKLAEQKGGTAAVEQEEAEDELKKPEKKGETKSEKKTET